MFTSAALVCDSEVTVKYPVELSLFPGRPTASVIPESHFHLIHHRQREDSSSAAQHGELVPLEGCVRLSNPWADVWGAQLDKSTEVQEQNPPNITRFILFLKKSSLCGTSAGGFRELGKSKELLADVLASGGVFSFSLWDYFTWFEVSFQPCKYPN